VKWLHITWKKKYTNKIIVIKYQFKRDTETDKNIVQKLFYIADVNDNLSVQFGKFSENWQLGYAFNNDISLVR
jgi:hypothetical protein